MLNASLLSQKKIKIILFNLYQLKVISKDILLLFSYSYQIRSKSIKSIKKYVFYDYSTSNIVYKLVKIHIICSVEYKTTHLLYCISFQSLC